MLFDGLESHPGVEYAQHVGGSSEKEGGHQLLSYTADMAGRQVNQHAHLVPLDLVAEPPRQNLVLDDDIFVAHHRRFRLSRCPGREDDQGRGMRIDLRMRFFQPSHEKIFDFQANKFPLAHQISNRHRSVQQFSRLRIGGELDQVPDIGAAFPDRLPHFAEVAQGSISQEKERLRFDLA